MDLDEIFRQVDDQIGKHEAPAAAAVDLQSIFDAVDSKIGKMEPESAKEYALGAASSPISGLTLGLSDEAIAATAAGLFGAPSYYLGLNDETPGEVYDRVLEQQRKTESDFAARHPYQNLAGEIGGSLLLPIPGAGLGAKTAARVIDAAPAATKAVLESGIGRLGIDSAISAATGAGVGAAHGFNEGEGGFLERLSQAGQEAPGAALFGAAVPTVATGVKELFRLPWAGAGPEATAGNILRDFATAPEAAVVDLRAKAGTPMPFGQRTTAELANDAGLARLEDATRNVVRDNSLTEMLGRRAENRSQAADQLFNPAMELADSSTDAIRTLKKSLKAKEAEEKTAWKAFDNLPSDAEVSLPDLAPQFRDQVVKFVGTTDIIPKPINEYLSRLEPAAQEAAPSSKFTWAFPPDGIAAKGTTEAGRMSHSELALDIAKAIKATGYPGYWDIGLRGLWKPEKLGELKRSRIIDGRDWDEVGRELSGTSVFKLPQVSASWSIDDIASEIAEELPNALERAKTYGDSDRIGLVLGSKNIDEVIDDLGEAVLNEAELLKAWPKSDLFPPKDSKVAPSAAHSPTVSLKELQQMSKVAGNIARKNSDGQTRAVAGMFKKEITDAVDAKAAAGELPADAAEKWIAARTKTAQKMDTFAPEGFPIVAKASGLKSVPPKDAELAKAIVRSNDTLTKLRAAAAAGGESIDSTAKDILMKAITHNPANGKPYAQELWPGNFAKLKKQLSQVMDPSELGALDTILQDIKSQSGARKRMFASSAGQSATAERWEAQNQLREMLDEAINKRSVLGKVLGTGIGNVVADKGGAVAGFLTGGLFDRMAEKIAQRKSDAYRRALEEAVTYPGAAAKSIEDALSREAALANIDKKAAQLYYDAARGGTVAPLLSDGLKAEDQHKFSPTEIIIGLGGGKRDEKKEAAPAKSAEMFQPTSLPAGNSGDLAAVLDAIRMVESGGGKYLRSPKGALGPYGFMPATAKDMGLKDPMDEKQSRAAAEKYLRWLIKQTGSLPAAILAYNHGVGNVQDLIDRTGSTDIEALIAGINPKNKEAREYYGKVLAAMGAA